MSLEERAAAVGLSLGDEASTRYWFERISESIRAAETVARQELKSLKAENVRLRLQLSTDHATARIAELIGTCSRHEESARIARRALRPFAKVPPSVSVVGAHGYLTDADFAEARRVIEQKTP